MMDACFPSDLLANESIFTSTAARADIDRMFSQIIIVTVFVLVVQGHAADRMQEWKDKLNKTDNSPEVSQAIRKQCCFEKANIKN
jgi:hypothetical protein